MLQAIPPQQGGITLDCSTVAVCCSVMQCVAVCCSVLQCDAGEEWLYTATQHTAAVCCSVLQCVAVCCSMLQCVAVCSSVLQGNKCFREVQFLYNVKAHFVKVTEAVCSSVMQCVAVFCSVLQCVAVCCSVLLQCVAVCCSVSRGRNCFREVQFPLCTSARCVKVTEVVCCSVMQCDVVCCSVLQCVAVWCSAIYVTCRLKF